MSRKPRMLDLRSGGWLLLLAAAVVAVLGWWMVAPLLRRAGEAVGDGRHVESYGFDLSAFRLPREGLVASGFPKQGLPRLDHPPVMPGSAVAAFNEAHRGKYLVPDDRVIGVVVDGEARAYPLRVLNWHEVANDTLAGRPIAVTYHPLCDSAAVFDRRVDGETLEFGVSGLLYDSNLLLFDRREDPSKESLWSQILGRAVSGPAAEAGRSLRPLPASLAHWHRWLQRHPDTTVVAPDPELLKRYQKDPYGNYLMTGRPRFPVAPLPPADAPPLMSRIVAVESGGRTTVYALDGCLSRGSGTCDDDGWLVVGPGERAPGVLVEAPPDAGVVYSLWFAWYAQRGSAGLR